MYGGELIVEVMYWRLLTSFLVGAKWPTDLKSS